MKNMPVAARHNIFSIHLFHIESGRRDVLSITAPLALKSAMESFLPLAMESVATIRQSRRCQQPL
jgi:hypothetical protein